MVGMMFILCGYVLIIRKALSDIDPREPKAVFRWFMPEATTTKNYLLDIERSIIPRIQAGVWQVVSGKNSIYLYSSFYDNRITGDGKPMIRLFGMAYKVLEGRTLHCKLWYANSPKPEIQLLSMEKYWKGWFQLGGKSVRDYAFSCPMRNATSRPQFVSVVVDPKDKPTTLLPVQELKHVRIKRKLLLCTIIYEKHDPRRLIEWLELYKIYGVNKVNVYHYDLNDGAEKIFRHYSRDGFVEMRSLPAVFEPMVFNGKPLHLAVMKRTAFNDCMYRNMYKFKHILFNDPDEIIVPRKHPNYNTLIENAQSEFSEVQFISSFQIQNAFYYFDLRNNETEKLLTLRYFSRLSPNKDMVKSFVDPMSCVAMNDMKCMIKTAKHAKYGFDASVKTDVAMVHHYKKCDMDIAVRKKGLCEEAMSEYYVDTIMEKFRPVLRPRVEEKVEQFKDLIKAFDKGEMKENDNLQVKLENEPVRPMW